MVLAVNEAFTTLLLVTDANNNPATGKTISYRIFDENFVLFDSGDMTEIGSYGIYYKVWTPDTEGYWTFEAYYTGGDFHFYDIKMYQVGKGVEDDIYDIVKSGGTGDLAAIKTETDKISALGTVADIADIDGTVTAKQRALYSNVHRYIGIIVADKTSLISKTQFVKTALEKKFEVNVLDDDDIDSGDADLEVYDIIFICSSVTDMTKINELTALGVPILACSPEAALTIMRLGNNVGGAGTSWGELAAQTQVNITNNTHQVVLAQSTGNLTVYDTPSTVTWIRKTDLVAGAVQIAEIAGDSTKVCIALLPYDEADEDANAAPMPRLYWGINDPTNWNTTAENLFFDMIDWLLHQGRRTVEVEGIGKINQVKALLEHGTYGLAALNTDLDAILVEHGEVATALIAIIADLNSPNQYKADVSALALEATLGTHDSDVKAVLVRKISRIDFWSEGVPVVNIPAGADQDINLPDVVVQALPAGATIWKVFLLFKCALIKDTTSPHADNAIDEAGVIRIKKDGDATFDGNGVDAYVIEDNKWSVDISEGTERGGDAFVGKTDLGPSGANKVDGADTYNLRLDSVSADGSNLVLVDVCVGLRIIFY